MRSRALPLTVAVLGLLLAHAAARADSIQAAVPFEFMIGDKVLPAAAYIFEVAGGTEPNVLTIRKMENGDRLMFDTNEIPAKDDPKGIELVFYTVGDKTYLAEVWGVTKSGRSVKHMIDGHLLLRPSDASLRHVSAERVEDRKDKERKK